jgi:hypothetical protein
LLKFLKAYFRHIGSTAISQSITALIPQMPHIIHVMALALQETWSAYVAAALAAGSPSHGVLRETAIESGATTLAKITQVLNSTHLHFSPAPPSYALFGLDTVNQHDSSGFSRGDSSVLGRQKRKAAEQLIPGTAAQLNGAKAAVERRRTAVKQIGFIRYSCAHNAIKHVCPMVPGLLQQFCFAFAGVGMSCFNPDACKMAHPLAFKDLKYPEDKAKLRKWQIENATVVQIDGMNDE